MMDETVLREVAWIGDRFVAGDIRGVILVFHGLGSTGLKGGPGYEEQEWAANGGLVVFPYYGPWSWMNRSSRASIDELVSSVYQHFKLAEGIPLIVTGGSMGGQGALIYTRYSAHRIQYQRTRAVNIRRSGPAPPRYRRAPGGHPAASSAPPVPPLL